jgi:uncharacterized protein (DUF58 family)
MSDLPILILALLILAILLQIDFIFYIIYVVAGVYIWSRWLTPRAFKNLRFEREYVDHAFLGEHVEVAVLLHNDGRLPIPWLHVTESVPPELSGGALPSYALSLRGGREADFSYDVQATRRGYYRLGPLSLRSGDLFGWTEISAQSNRSYLTVYPKITPLARLGLPSRLPFGTIASNQQLFADPARPIGVRSYRSGDSLRQINWKVSAHSDSLVVKTLQPAISLDTMILLNLNLGDFDRQTRYSAPEWAIEIAASLGSHLTSRQQAVGLATNGIDPLRQGEPQEGDLSFDEASGRLLVEGGLIEGSSLLPAPIPSRNGRDHLMKVLELLARVEAARTVPFLAWIPTITVGLTWGITVPVITPSGDEATCQTLHQLVRAGLNPILIVTAPTHRFGEIRERARRLGFSAFHVRERKDLDIWRRPPLSIDV